MNILITGPIGSGKTTQAQVLAQELGATLIKTGDLIRVASQGNTPEAQVLRDHMTAGHMVPDEMMAKLLQQEIAKAGNIVILDSYPRRLSQLDVYNPGIDKVIYLDVLLSRGRIDDTPTVIKNRLRVYHQETVPLLDYYRQKNELITIDANGTIDEVKDRIKVHLLELQN
jgi:adenylate kinase